MRVALIVVSGKSNVREVVLGEDTLIGRSPECRLKVASTEVSRKHCRIRVRGQQVLVCDLGSSNGTLLNGKALAPMTEVIAPPKARLLIGPLEFLVDYQPEARPQPALDSVAETDGHTIVERVSSVPAAPTSSVSSVVAALGAARGALSSPVESPARSSDEASISDSTLFDLGLDPAPAPTDPVSGSSEPTREVSKGSISVEKTVTVPTAASADATEDDVVPLPGSTNISEEPSLPMLMPAEDAQNADFDTALQDFLKGL